MSNKPIPTIPVSDNEKLLRAKFYESIAAQSQLMDKLSERLLTLELAIPGLYATAVKLIAGEKVTISVNITVYAAYGCWLIALILTLIGLTPRKWVINPDLLRQDPQKYADALGIEDFFHKSAQYKRRFVIASSLLFFVGIMFATFTVINP